MIIRAPGRCMSPPGYLHLFMQADFAFLAGVHRYSHGFLFPSEVKRVQEGVMRDLRRLAQQTAGSEVSTIGYTPIGQHVPTPEMWAHSSVSKWHVRYSPPVSDLSLDYSVEALVEGSDMSMIHDGAFVLC